MIRRGEPQASVPWLDVTWEEAADAIAAIVYVVDARGSVRYVNRYWETFTGHSRDAVLDDAWMELTHADDLAHAVERMRHGIENGMPFSIELRVRDRQGVYHWFRSTGSPHRDARGEIVAWFGVAVEIGEARRSEAALAQSQTALRTFIETIPVIVWTADATGWIDWYNPRWFEFTGQTPAEAAGWGWQAAHHPDDFPRVMDAWPHSVATGEPFEMEFRLRRHDGVYHWFLARVVPHRDEGGRIVRWYGSVVDIDAQKQSEQRASRVARTMQDAFLPATLPKHDHLRLDALYLAAETEALIGGDWYDVFVLDDGRILISSGDVAGHGIDAAAAAAGARQAIAFAAVEDADPARVLERTNRLLLMQQAPVTAACVAVFDPQTQLLRYSLAGHPPPAIALPGRDVTLAQPGTLALGIEPKLDASTCEIQLERDAVAVFYTDGFTEYARDIASAETRLLAAVQRLVGDGKIPRPAVALREAVLADARPRDDVAVIVLQCTPADPAALGRRRDALVKRWRFHSSDAYTAQSSRRELALFLDEHAEDPDELFVAELILGELLANTVEHAPGLVEVTIDWTRRQPVATVRDTGPGFHYVRASLPSDPLSEDGRGLFLISALGEDVAIAPSEGFGTDVRVTLPIRRREEA